MKNITKKLIIYSMVAMMQCGVGATISEASQRHDGQKEAVRNEGKVQRSDNDRASAWNGQQRYEERNHENLRQDQRRQEAVRHEREMQRRDNERESAWHERQRCESERHNQNLKTIETAALVYLLLSK